MQTNNCIARAVQSVSLAVIIPLRVGEQRKVDATLHEGTSMAALSPDGRTIAIDLLGRIWTLPTSGGTRPRLAYPLLSGTFLKRLDRRACEDMRNLRIM